jgi:hypothetical protein
MKPEGLIHFLRIQTAVAQQLSGKQQNRYFVAETHPRGGIKVNIDNIYRHTTRRRQRGKLAQHLLAQAAARARVQQEAIGINDEESRRRCRFSPNGR